MPTLTKQILLKISPELEELIDRAFSAHLKETGEYITRSDYIRRMINAQCMQELSKTSTNNDKVI